MGMQTRIQWADCTFQSVARLHKNQRRLQKLLRRNHVGEESGNARRVGAARYACCREREHVEGAAEVEQGGGKGRRA